MTIQDVLNDLGGVIHGTTINKIPNVYGVLNRAARTLLLDVDPKETQRIVPLTSQVFNDVYDYALPTDVKGDRIIDLRLQAGRMPGDVFAQTYAKTFDAQKLVGTNQRVYVQHNTGVKTMRIEAPLLASPLVLSSTGVLANWSATAGAQNLSLDSTNNVAGSGAIQFDLAAGSATGSIETSTLDQIDVTGHVNIDSLFFWVYLPTASAITNLILKWGSDYTANYYTYTATTNQQGNAFVDGWNLIAVPWASATLVGSPTITAYDSVQLTVTYNSTLQTGVKFCNLTSNTGSIFELQYYSKYLFRNPTTNAFVEKVTDITFASYLINLDTESYNLYFNLVALYAAQSLQGADAEYDANYWKEEYVKALASYKALNPNEVIKKSEVYYRMPQKGYTRFNPRNKML